MPQFNDSANLDTPRVVSTPTKDDESLSFFPPKDAPIHGEINATRSLDKPGMIMPGGNKHSREFYSPKERVSMISCSRSWDLQEGELAFLGTISISIQVVVSIPF